MEAIPVTNPDRLKANKSPELEERDFVSSVSQRS